MTAAVYNIIIKLLSFRPDLSAIKTMFRALDCSGTYDPQGSLSLVIGKSHVQPPTTPVICGRRFKTASESTLFTGKTNRAFLVPWDLLLAKCSNLYSCFFIDSEPCGGEVRVGLERAAEPQVETHNSTLGLEVLELIFWQWKASHGAEDVRVHPRRQAALMCDKYEACYSGRSGKTWLWPKLELKRSC